MSDSGGVDSEVEEQALARAAVGTANLDEAEEKGVKALASEQTELKWGDGDRAADRQGRFQSPSGRRKRRVAGMPDGARAGAGGFEEGHGRLRGERRGHRRPPRLRLPR